MKLGIMYTVWNGEELLKNSIKQIIDEVDEIVILYQLISNRGQYSHTLLATLNKIVISLNDKKKIRLVEFIPNLHIDTKTNELNKHNLGLQELKKLECTHFILSATDHYYNRYEFREAKKISKDRDFDVTLTAMYTYYKHPTWQITPIEDYYMPFICKLYRNTDYIKTQWKYKVDPAVRINTSNSIHLFSSHIIMMHHYSMIRQDIENKFNNAAASSRWGDKAKIYLDEYNNVSLESKLAYFGGRGLKEVENYFAV